MLDERKAAILRAVVEEYIHTAQPVGSGHVADAPGVEVSSATVRNDMAAARAGGLPPPAAHLGRAGPHRQGLPLLRRRSSPARPARPSVGPPGAGVLRHRPRRPRADAARHHPPAVRPHRLRRRRGRRRTPEAAEVRSAQLVGLAPSVALLVVGARQRCRSRSAPSSWPRPATDGRRWPPPPPTSGRHLIGSHARRTRPVAPSRPTRRSTEVLVAAQRCLGEWPRGRARAGLRRRHAPAWPRRSTRSRPSARCSPSSSSSCVVVTLLRDVLDRGLQVAIGTETGVRPAGRLLARRRPLRGRRRAGRHDRRARSHPHELSAGTGRRRRRQPAPRPSSDRRLIVPTDYYELLGVGPRRQRRRAQEGVPPQARELHPDANPTTRRPRRTSRRCRSPTRC